jgi:hypothetical protein
MFAATDDWPNITLTTVPPLTAAELLAAAVRDSVSTSSEACQDLSTVLALGRFELRICALSARGGGIEAALAPRSDDRFALLVDTEPRNGWESVNPRVREELSRHRLRFRVAHEIGHSFFYDRSGQRPRRVVFDSSEQERWCDRFASSLLLPPSAITAAPPSPRALIRLQRHFDVSLQVAARAVARVHRERFIALLVARGARPPHVRVQWQKQHVAPSARWWTARELQSALASDRRSGSLDLPWPSGERVASWHALPSRGQLLVVA